jgi:NAD(P)-dependent dehydrogenase (short-subunit alcohol dehydrogenase family)
MIDALRISIIRREWVSITPNFPHRRPWSRAAREAWLSDFELDLFAAVLLNREIVPSTIHRGRGVVVHVSSIASHFPQPQPSSYSASKAAMNSYSRSLAAEVGPTGGARGHRSAGVHRYCRRRRASPEDGDGARHLPRTDTADLALALKVSMAGPHSAEDATELVAFLASDRAKRITGAEFRVDGDIIPTA